jgi:integrase/recombinase XerC
VTLARRRPAAVSLRGLRQVIAAWLAARKAATAKTYRADLADFAAWYGDLRAPTAADVDAALLDLFSQPVPAVNAIALEYQADLLSRPVWNSNRARDTGQPPDRSGLAPSTVNRRLSALKSVAKIARIAGHFTGEIEIPGIAVRAYRNTLGVGSQGYQQLVDALSAKVDEFRDVHGGYDWAKYPRAVRDLAILRLLHDAGLRRIEVVRLRTGDVVADRATIVLQPKGPTGDTLDWELGAAPWATLQAWLAVRGPEPGALFHGIGRSPTKHMHVSTVNRLIGDRARELGLRVRPHDLRHTAITTALDRTDGNLRDVQKFSRHKNVTTVGIYDDKRRGVARGIQDLISDKDPQ